MQSTQAKKIGPIESVTRRDFFSLSAKMSIGLRFLTLPAAFVAQFSYSQSTQFRFLRDRDIPTLTAMIPAIVNGKISTESATATSQAIMLFDQVCGQLAEKNRDDLLRLLDLFNFSVTRAAMGIWSSWERATADEIIEALRNLQGSRLGILRLAGSSIAKLANFAWHGIAAGISSTNYPGPPSAIIPFLHAEEKAP